MIERYVNAFKKKDMAALRQLFSDTMSFQDPSCGLLQGKENVLKFYEGIFQNDILSVDVKRQLTKDQMYFVEFSLVIKDQPGNRVVVDGVDILEMKDGKIASIRAYLDTSDFVQRKK